MPTQTRKWVWLTTNVGGHRQMDTLYRDRQTDIPHTDGHCKKEVPIATIHPSYSTILTPPGSDSVKRTIKVPG